jgi:hypothetical protein
MISKNKKAKSKTTAKKTAKKKSEAKAKPETNPAEVRKEVSKLVEAEAADMAKAVIEEARKGQLAPTKYLFEVASIYPPQTDGSQATPEEDCLAKILLDKLKLASKPVEEADAEAGNGNAAEDTAAANSGAMAQQVEGMGEPMAEKGEDDCAGDKLDRDKAKPGDETADGAAEAAAE